MQAKPSININEREKDYLITNNNPDSICTGTLFLGHEYTPSYAHCINRHKCNKHEIFKRLKNNPEELSKLNRVHFLLLKTFSQCQLYNDK